MLKRAAVLTILVLSLVGNPLVLAQGGDDVTGTGEYSGKLPAVELPSDLEWVNLTEPLTFEKLRGKVVLLNFWAYGCVECLQVIPDLERLAEAYPEELVVVGVHSARCPAEQDTERIRKALERYKVTFPVANDVALQVLNAWGIRETPTVMLIDPQGMVFGYHVGEGVYNVLQPAVAGMVAQFDEAGLLNRSSLAAAVGAAEADRASLSFPGSVLPDADGRRLFVADSGNNRIVVADLDEYGILSMVGGVEHGFSDGGFRVARFGNPQGMVLSEDGRVLYVADAGNHAIRAIDFEMESVTTIAGGGEKVPSGSASVPGMEAALNSPWDLVRVGQMLYITMAGANQIWTLDLSSNFLSVLAGSGEAGTADGHLLTAQLAQPMGVASAGSTLYVVDSEASAVREVVPDAGGMVTTLVGSGLYQSGDQDGMLDEAGLQFPSDVASAGGLLFVADTFNDKVRVIDLTAGTVATLSMQGEGEMAGVPLDEPGGLGYASDHLYVADTNNHAIRVIDLITGSMSTVQFPNPERLLSSADTRVEPVPFSGATVALEPAVVGVGAGEIVLNVIVPDGYKFNDLAPFGADWHPDDVAIQVAEVDRSYRSKEPEMPLLVPAVFSPGETQLSVDLSVYYCEAVNESVCFVERVQLVVPVTVRDDGGLAALQVTYVLVPPAPRTEF